MIFQLTIEIDHAVKPGGDANLKLKSSPKSHVFLLGVDKSVKLLGGGNDIDEEKVAAILTRNTHYSSFPEISYNSTGKIQRFPEVEKENLFVLFNSNFTSESVAGGPVDGPKVREHFPETWLFEDLRLENGEQSLTRKVPDSITTFVVSGFSIEADLGLAIAEPASIKVFQNFFINPILPRTMRLGETLRIDVHAFNYVGGDVANIKSDVTLKKHGDDFDFYEPKSSPTGCELKKVNANQQTKPVSISIGSGNFTFFLIKPLKIGELKLDFSAKTTVRDNKYEDAVKKSIRVVGEGIKHMKNEARLIDLSSGQPKKEDIKLDIPDTVIPDSISIEASVIGDLLGPIFDNFQLIP